MASSTLSRVEAAIREMTPAERAELRERLYAGRPCPRPPWDASTARPLSPAATITADMRAEPDDSDTALEGRPGMAVRG